MEYNIKFVIFYRQIQDTFRQVLCQKDNKLYVCLMEETEDNQLSFQGLYELIPFLIWQVVVSLVVHGV